jgi:hypothetical protein
MEKYMAKTNEQTAKAPAPVMRSSAGLRDALFDEMDALRNGNSNPTRANAVAKLAGSIVETVHMEMEVERHLRHAAPSVNIETFGGVKPLRLGA